MSGTPVVVVGLGMTGLGVVRSLAPYGMPIVAVDTSPRKASGYTRLCRKVLVDGSSDLWDAVIRLGRESSDRPVLVLTSDIAVLEASRRREELSRIFRFRLPDEEHVRVLMDKTEFAAFAERHGLPVPKTFTIRDGQGWRRVLDGCRFPCLIKPKYRSKAWVDAGLTKVFRAEDRRELERLIERLGEVEGDYVVQEWIPGPDSDVFFRLAYYDGGCRPRLAFTGRKIRQWPPLLGSTAVAEGAESDEVEQETRRLFELVRFRGLGSVEFKWDARDSRFKIMEATVGRPNLQSELATANGVNIVYGAYRELTGGDVEPLKPAARKVRWIFLDNDLTSALHYWRRGELTLGGFLRSYRSPRYYADFAWTDPMPFLAEVSRAARNAMRLLFGSKRRVERQLN